jgi:hypothetical protein
VSPKERRRRLCERRRIELFVEKSGQLQRLPAPLMPPNGTSDISRKQPGMALAKPTVKQIAGFIGGMLDCPQAFT